MTQIPRLVAIFLISAPLFFVNCSTNMAFLVERSRSEAKILQETCQKAGLKNKDISAGDAMMTVAAKASQDEEAEKSRLALEQAAGHYRLALAMNAKTNSEGNLAEEQKALAKDKDRLSTYTEILGEMKTMRKP